MKKELSVHFISAILFFVIITLLKGWFSFNFWPFWIGAIIGTIIPDIDHFIYIYFLRPQELSSQRAGAMIQRREVFRTLHFLARTRSERKQLVFHTALFQILLLIFTFYILTSSSSLFGKGIVLGFFIHLLVDQFIDFKKTGNLANWFWQLNINLDKEQTKIYWIGNFIILILLTFFL